jgi:transcriptional regulator with XRE-family HTH domain
MAARRRLAERRRAQGLTQEALAHMLDRDVTTVARWERGETTPQPWHRKPYADALGVDLDDLDAMLDGDAEAVDVGGEWTTVRAPDLDDLEALELIRRVEASDAGPATLDAIERAVDRLCRSYTSTPPAELRVTLRAHRSYVARLLDGRATLAQRRQLMTFAGWLSLLTAIVDVDLHQRRAAAANLDAARVIGTEAGHPELLAWAFEIDGWQAVADGR